MKSLRFYNAGVQVGNLQQTIAAANTLQDERLHRLLHFLKLIDQHGHATASTLWRASGWSSATFYRILKWAIQQGLVSGITVGVHTYFGLGYPAHAHLVCERCGTVQDVPLPSFEIPDTKGWVTDRVTLVLYSCAAPDACRDRLPS